MYDADVPAPELVDQTGALNFDHSLKQLHLKAELGGVFEFGFDAEQPVQLLGLVEF